MLTRGAIFESLLVSPNVSVVKSEWTLFEQCVSDFSFLCPAPLRHITCRPPWPGGLDSGGSVTVYVLSCSNSASYKLGLDLQGAF